MIMNERFLSAFWMAFADSGNGDKDWVFVEKIFPYLYWFFSSDWNWEQISFYD